MKKETNTIDSQYKQVNAGLCLGLDVLPASQCVLSRTDFTDMFLLSCAWLKYATKDLLDNEAECVVDILHPSMWDKPNVECGKKQTNPRAVRDFL